MRKPTDPKTLRAIFSSKAFESALSRGPTNVESELEHLQGVFSFQAVRLKFDQITLKPSKSETTRQTRTEDKLRLRRD